MILIVAMKRRRPNLKLPRNSITESLALVALLMMGAWAVAGPSGLLAWSENAHTLEVRQQEVVQLSAERERLQNRVNLLDPRHADPDLVGELLRADLNVAHPDELVIPRQEAATNQ
jgi:cell division protein FtsB